MIPKVIRGFGCPLNDTMNRLQGNAQMLNVFQNLSKSTDLISNKLPLQNNEVNQISSVKSFLKVNGSKTRRKQARPQKSPDMWDPNFRGATILFSGASCNDVFVSPFPKLATKSNGNQHMRNNIESSVKSTSSCDKEGVTETIYSRSKSCASCETKKTPLWRDAEDGTPLCNACGIRFRKYRLRCSRCWHIPKKDNKTFPDCYHCGSRLRFQGRFHKHTSYCSQ